MANLEPTLWIRDRNGGAEFHVNESFAFMLEERDPGRFEVIDGPTPEDSPKPAPTRRIQPPSKRISKAERQATVPEIGEEDVEL